MLYSNFAIETIQPLQDKLSKDIKAFIEKALEAGKISIQDLGKKTGYGDDWMTSCLKCTKEWDISFCLWIANEVGYPISLTAGRKLVNITSPGFAYMDLEKE